MNVAERIKEFLNFKRISVNSLSKQLSITQTTLNRQFNGTVTLSVEAVLAVLEYFPELSAEWLLRGVGQMTQTVPQSESELSAVCIDQAKEIYRLKQRIAELEGEKKDRA